MKRGTAGVVARSGVIACSMLLAACASIAPMRPSARLPATARESPQRFVVVTVRNPLLAAGAEAASTPRGYDRGPYTAGLIARRDSQSLAKQYGLHPVSSWPMALLGVHCLVYALPADADPHAMLVALARDRRVESAQPLFAFTTESGGYNDPYSPLQRNLAAMSILEAQVLSRGAGVRIAIIDTGAALDHPDLSPAVAARNFVDDDALAFREDAHGTAVAGLIGAVPNNGVGIAGIAPDAKLLLFKACWRLEPRATKAACNSFTLAQALAAAIDAHADVINLSLAGPSDPLLTRLVNRAVAEGIIVVGAVPPDGLRDEFPTNIGAVIAVDTLEGTGTSPDVVRVPGREVLSLAPGGHYDFYSGSSLATAQVSGLVALLRARDRHLSARQAETILLQSAGRSSPSVPPDACAALASLMKMSSCREHPSR
jgi:subtilisin family serine protease